MLFPSKTSFHFTAPFPDPLTYTIKAMPLGRTSGCCKLLLQPSLPFSQVVSSHCSWGACCPSHFASLLSTTSIPDTLISPHSAPSSVLRTSPACHFVNHLKPHFKFMDCTSPQPKSKDSGDKHYSLHIMQVLATRMLIQEIEIIWCLA